MQRLFRALLHLPHFCRCPSVANRVAEQGTLGADWCKASALLRLLYSGDHRGLWGTLSSGQGQLNLGSFPARLRFWDFLLNWLWGLVGLVSKSGSIRLSKDQLPDWELHPPGCMKCQMTGVGFVGLLSACQILLKLWASLVSCRQT
jgi:hypothetical protein